MDDKISIPKLKVKSIKNPNIMLLDMEEDNEVKSSLKVLHEELNGVFELVTDEDTEAINYIVLMWDTNNLDRVGVTWEVGQFSPMFLLPDFIKDAIQKSIYTRLSFEETYEDE